MLLFIMSAYGGGFYATREGEWLVGPNVELLEGVARGPLSEDTKRKIQRQALERLSVHDPMLRHMMEIKVVCNQRRNFVNILVKREYVTLCHKDVFEEVRYCFFLSDKIEPYVIITAVDPSSGRLGTLTQQQIDHLSQSVANFKVRFGISGESYHYTGLSERQETDQFVASGGASRATKSHSSHFHLKMRIATEMYKSKLPVMTLFDLNALRTNLEPVRYNFSRECMSWDDTLATLLKDAADSSDPSRKRSDRTW